MKDENLTKACISYVAKRYSIFRDKFHILPSELVEEIQQEKTKIDNRAMPPFYMFNGRWFPLDNAIQVKTDWESYKL